MKPAAIYARVSTQKQAEEGTSLDGQIEACRQFAQRNGYTVTHVEKEDISGARLDRPGLDCIRDMAARGEIAALIVWDIDRLSRDMAHQYILDAEFERHKVRLVFVNSPTEDTPSGKMFLGMKRVFAEFERATIADRFRRGKERVANAGSVLGSSAVPYGYRYIPRKKKDDEHGPAHGGYFEILESEAYWVTQIYHWIVNQRYTLGEVARHLNAMKVPCKRSAQFWEPSTVRRLVVNPLYAGNWTWNKTEAVAPSHPEQGRRPKKVKCSATARPREEWIRVGSPAIVSIETYEAALRQIKSNKALAGRVGKRRHLLRGMLTCRYCGRRLVGHGTVDTQYRCTGKRDRALKDAVHAPYVRASRVEPDIWEEVAQRMSNKALIRASLATLSEGLHEERRRDEAQLADLYNAEQEISRERHKLLNIALAEQPLFDAKTIQEHAQTLDKKQASINTARAEIEDRMRRLEITRVNQDAVERMCDMAQLGLPLFTEDDKREFLRALDLRGVVDHERIHFTWVVDDPIIVFLKGKIAEKGAVGTDDTHDALAEPLAGQTETPNKPYKPEQCGRTIRGSAA